MSFTKNDRKSRSKRGKSFPGEPGPPDRSFKDLIAEALRAEFGETPSAVKTIARLARSNERAARNWLDGVNGPSGENLVRLMRHSDVVLRTVLLAANRKEQAVSVQLASLRTHLAAALSTLDALKS